MNCLEVIDIAAGASVQDLGRKGFQRYGVTAGGAMDRFALAEGQALLGNDSSSAALEFSVRGGRFGAIGALAVATSGAEMDVRINGIARPWRSTLFLQHGDCLEIGSAKRGVYGYLHLSGGIDSPLELGSRSYFLAAGIGRELMPGNRLCAMAETNARLARTLSRNDYLDRRSIRAVPSAQSGMFPESMRRDFERSEFEILPMRDRQGIRLSATAGPFFLKEGLRVASAAISRGDIQISGDGTPVVLMADAQPTGGFPRIACVIAADQDAVAQMPVGDKFRIRMVRREEAIAELKRMHWKVGSLRPQAEESELAESEADGLLGHSLISGAIRGDEHEID